MFKELGAKMLNLFQRDLKKSLCAWSLAYLFSQTIGLLNKK